MKGIHFVLQAKGGVGKSFVASLIAQSLDSKSNFDLDQSNQTFAAYDALGAEYVEALDENAFIVDAKRFDALVAQLTETELAVIDTGANSFGPLMAYLVENGIFELLSETGRQVWVHTIVAGGAELEDTTNGFESIAAHSPNLVLWLNEHFGTTEINGKPFNQSNAYKSASGSLRGVITLPKLNAQTIGDDLRKLVRMRKTFDEAKTSPDFTMMEKHRLSRFFKSIDEQLKKIEA